MDVYGRVCLWLKSNPKPLRATFAKAFKCHMGFLLEVCVSPMCFYPWVRSKCNVETQGENKNKKKEEKAQIALTFVEGTAMFS